MAGRPKSRFECDREFLRGLVDDSFDTRIAFCRHVGIEAKTLREALSSKQPILSYEVAAKIGQCLSIPFLDFFPPDDRLDRRLHQHGLGIPREHADQPTGDSWARRDVENGIRAALEAGKPIVLHGPPGSGKSSLASSFAEELSEQYSRGIVWIDARQAFDASSTQHRIASALHFFRPGPDVPAVSEATTNPLPKEFARYFWARQRLMVIENVDDHAFVQDITRLSGLPGGRNPQKTPIIVLTESAAVAQALVVHERFESFEIPALDEHVVLDHLGRAMKMHGDAEHSAIRPLADAIAGRPASLRLAVSRLGDGRVTAEEVTRDLELESLSEPVRELLWTLRVFSDAEFSADWGHSVSPDLPADVFQTRLEILQQRQHIELTPTAQFRVRHHVRKQVPLRFERIAEKAIERARLHLRRHMRIAARRSEYSDGHREEAEFLKNPRLWEVALNVLIDHPAEDAVEAKSANSQPLSRHAFVDVMTALRAALPYWDNPRVERWLFSAIDTAHSAGRAIDEAQLRIALARWLIHQRADFVTAIGILERAIAVTDGTLAEEMNTSALLAGSSARVELGRALFPVGRAAESGPLFFQALTQARQATDDPEVLALRLNALAMSMTRLPMGPAGCSPENDPWAMAEELLVEQRELLSAAASECTTCMRQVTEFNLEMVRFIRNGRRDEVGLRVTLERLLPDAAGGIRESLLLATALEYDLDLLGGGLGAQRRRCAEVWKRALDSQEENPRTLQFFLGEVLFYLTQCLGPTNHGPGPISAGTAISDFSVGRGGSCLHGEACYFLFCPKPLLDVFDDELLERTEDFLVARSIVDLEASALLMKYRALRPPPTPPASTQAG